MKKVLSISLLLGIAGVSAVFMLSKTEEKVEKPRKGPGFFDFIKEVQGIPPAGVVSAWQQNSAQYKNQNSPLDSVIEVGPYNVGGRTRAILWDKFNPGHIMVGGISGGMWNSSDSGRHWTALNDQEITLNVSHVTQSPFDQNIIYYSTGEGSGNSSAAPGAGIFKSTDGGQTFAQLPATANGTFDYAWRICHSLVDSHTIYVATGNSGLYRSKDAGQSFERVYATTREVHDVEVFEDSTVMFTVRGIGIFTSKNAEPSTITQMTQGLPNSNTFGRVELAYCGSQQNVMYAAFSNFSNNDLSELYRSNDSGYTWTATTTNPTNKGGTFSFTWYCLALQVKYDDPDQVLIGSVNIMYTSDAGINWKAARNSHSDYHSMEVHPSRPDKIIIGNDGGVHEYNWNTVSNSFVDLNEGLNITQFYAGGYGPQGYDLIGGTQDNGTHQSRDLADSFSKVYGADGSYAHIHQQKDPVAYLSWQNGMIRKTLDYRTKSPATFSILNELDGNRDNTVDDGAWFINPFTVNYKDGEQVYYVTRRRLWRSNTGGILWDPATNNINSGSAQTPFAVGISNQVSPMAFVGGSNGLFYRIKNVSFETPGKEENLRNLSPVEIRTSFISSIKVSPITNSVVYISMSNYSTVSRLWRIDKADQDTPVWTNIGAGLPSNLPVNWVEVDPASPDSVILVGTNNGLYYSVDAGTTWAKDDRIPSTTVDMIQVRESDRRVFIFTHGRGSFVARLTPYGKPVPDYNAVSVQSVKPAEAKVYPNPATDRISLVWDGTQNSRHFVVVDAQGKQILKGQCAPGEEIQLGNQVPGIYYIKVEGIEAKKFLIQ
ncbi:MAG: T9SS type A sorting domain-containing protein [Bacteroidetes bacterium]|nr:MAG: T9SS type A sorting domain-containing protein [Bacteroidota bacterium]